MFVNTFTRRLIFNFIFLFIIAFISFLLFYDIYISEEIIISFVVNPFNLYEKYYDFWLFIKVSYIPISTISYIICINSLYSSIFSKKKIINKQENYTINSDLYISIFSNKEKPIIIPESGLYQNFLITGTIGSGKTSSVMYPFTKQLIEYSHDDNQKKLGMLILDVKGNYYSQVKKYANFYKRDNDLIIIEIRPEILNIIRLISQI